MTIQHAGNESPLMLSAPPAKKASTKAFKKAARKSWWKLVRHPIRIAVTVLAAMALTWDVVGALGAVSCGVAAGSGVLVGEWLGKGKLKLGVVLGGSAAGLCAFWLMAHLAVSTEPLALMVGPGAALASSVVLRFAAFAFWPVLALRASAVRYPSVVAAEVVTVAAATGVLFSSHRGGVISRPFWLSDWAWRAGLDPTHVLLGVGGVTVVVLVALMVAETGRRITWLSALSLPLAAALALTFVNLKGLPKPNADNELGLTDKSEKETSNTQTRPIPSAEASSDTAPTATASAGPHPSAGPSAGPSSAPTDPKGPEEEDGAPKPEPSEDSGEPQEPQQPQLPQEPQEREDGEPPPNKNAPLAVVLLGDDYAPPAQAFYFRQEVMSHYTGSRLVAPKRSGVDLDTITEFPNRKVTVTEKPPKDDRKVVRGDVALLVEHTHPFGLEAPVSFSPRPNPNPQRFVRAYHFKSYAQGVGYASLIGRKPGNPEWEDDVRDYYLVPSNDVRFAELAKKVVEKLPEPKRQDPFLAALAVKRWMDKELIYSTKERHANVPDPTADFLFGNRTGYCVHFAHAAVFMWRSLGIPARMGAGYMVSADDREGSSLLIRAGDAHAWPELYLEDIGWVVLDIAAEQNLDPQIPPTDKDLQRKLSELARQKPPKVEGPEDMDERPWIDAFPSPWLVLLVLLITGLTVLYAIKIWRRLAPMFAKERAMTRVGYRLALDLLAEVGLTREHGEPRESFARRVHAQVPAFSELTRMHLAARFGNPAVQMNQREEFSLPRWKDGLARLKRERKTVAKAGARVLSALNPATLFWAK